MLLRGRLVRLRAIESDEFETWRGWINRADVMQDMDRAVRPSADEHRRYVEAAVYLVTCNAQPYSHYDWHWRLLVAHRFGHAAAAPTVHGTLQLLDEAGIEGELVVRQTRSGRVEVTQMWGRPESVREEFRRLRAQ